MASNYKKLKTIRKAEKIYKEIAEEDKRLAEDFLSISFVDFERIEKEFKKAGKEYGMFIP